MASHLGVEPDMYKVLVYNQLSPDEVAKANLDIKKGRRRLMILISQFIGTDHMCLPRKA
ncbi:MAG: hypothetical protein ACYCPP_09115 [Nitrososphaerales archaeon]